MRINGIWSGIIFSVQWLKVATSLIIIMVNWENNVVAIFKVYSQAKETVMFHL